MRKSDLAEDQAGGPGDIAGRRARGMGWAVALVAGIILLEAGWRTWLGGEFLFDSTVPGRSVTLLDWRMLDQFAGWLGLSMLMLADGGEGAGVGEMLQVMARWMVGAGVVVVAVGLMWGNAAGVTGVLAAGLLAIAAAMLAWRMLGVVALGLRAVGGMTIEQLCRLVAVQWMLVWMAAEVFLRIKLRRQGGVEAEDAARSLLFALPAFGFLPNVMMTLGIRWLGSAGFGGRQPDGAADARRAAGAPLRAQVRVRAWMLGLLAVNLGAVGLVLSEFGRARLGWLTVVAAVPMVLGLAIYLLGFSPARWRGAGGGLVAAGLATLAVGIVMAAGERVASGELVLREYSAAWRFLVVPGSMILWLAGMGRAAIAVLVAPRVRSPAAEMVASLLVILGVVLTAALLVLAAVVDREWLEGVGFGAVLVFLGVAVGCAVGMRAWRRGRAR